MKRSFFLLAMVGTFVGLAAVPAARADITIDYVFSPDASITFGTCPVCDVFALSGTFDFNVDTGEADSIDIVLSNSDLSIDYVSLGYNGDPGAVDSNYALGYLSEDLLGIGFSSSLALGEVDDLATNGTSSAVIGSVTGLDPYALAVTGSADPVSAPEPASLALFGSALLVGLGAGGKWSSHRVKSQQIAPRLA